MTTDLKAFKTGHRYQLTFNVFNSLYDKRNRYKPEFLSWNEGDIFLFEGPIFNDDGTEYIGARLIPVRMSGTPGNISGHIAQYHPDFNALLSGLVEISRKATDICLVNHIEPRIVLNKLLATGVLSEAQIEAAIDQLNKEET